MRASNFLFFVLLFLGKHDVFSQSPSATWPFPNVNRPNCSSMPPAATTCTKWAVKNGRWDNGDTWNGGTIPKNRDIVCVPSGITVTVKNPTYTAATVCPATDTNATPNCYLFVCGIVDFDASGKLHLGCNSSISILPGGTVLPANGNSDLIQIGTTVVWRDNNSTLTGPSCVCVGCPSNNTGCTYSAPLPAQFISFSASQKNQHQVDLNWSTNREVNVNEFVIERSINATQWSAIGMMKAISDERTTNTYSFGDHMPNAGMNYYRLKQVDRDGHFVFSNIVLVNLVDKGAGFSVFPNPAKDKITVYSSGGLHPRMQLQLFKKDGVMVKSIFVQSANSQMVDIGELSNGFYFLRIIDEKGSAVHVQSVIKN